MTDSNSLTKTCTACNKTYPATAEYFHRLQTGKFGLHSTCKSCRADKAKDRYLANRDDRIQQVKDYRESNKEKVAETKRRYREANKESIAKTLHDWYTQNRERVADYHRQYRADNESLVKSRKKKYYADNPDKRRAGVRRYSKTRKGKMVHRISESKRRARKRSLPNTFTTEQWDYCLEYFNFTCPVCDNQLRDLFGNVEPHADHWMPLSYEGDDNPGTVAENMVCLCNTCNLSKGAKMPDAWLEENYSKSEVNHIKRKIADYFSILSS